ncbi:MAG TPA: AI-2E family transporter [Acidimicrobiales bacterium]
MADGDQGAAAAAEEVLRVDLDWRSAALACAGVVGLVAVFAIASATSRTLTWVVIGLLLALAMDPLVDRIQEVLGLRRGVAVGCVLASFFLALTLVALLLGPETARQARTLSEDLPEVVGQLGDLPVVGDTLQRNDVPQKVENWLNDLPETLAGPDANLGDRAESILSGLLAAMSTGLIVIMLLLDGDRLVGAFQRLTPDRHRHRIDRAGRQFYEIVGRYFAGSLFVALLHGLYVLTIGLVLGVPLAPLLGLWAAVASLIPQIGGALAGAPFVLLGFTEGATTGVICLIAFVLYLNFENHILSPIIVGEAVNLSAPTTMVGAIVGASVAGVPGALVAVPLLGAGKAIYLEATGQARSTKEGSISVVTRLRRLAHREPKSPKGAETAPR